MPDLKIQKVNRSQIYGKDGFYLGGTFNLILIADDLDPEHEAEVIEHEMAHARGDDLGEEPI